MKHIIFAILIIIAANGFGLSDLPPCDHDCDCLERVTGENARERVERDYVFGIGPQFGIAYGQALELVYQTPGMNESEFLSELIWDMKPVMYAGLQFDFERKDIFSAAGFFSSLSFKYGIPADSGIMENRDWQSSSHSNLTDYSRHTNKTRDFFSLDATIGISLPVIDSLLFIKPFISGSWMHFAFTGRDGYGEYPPDESASNYRKIDYTGQNVITYEQDWFLVSTGITVGAKINIVTIDLSFKASLLSWCNAVDEHLPVEINGITSPKKIFKDKTAGGLFLEPSLNVSVAIRRIDLSLGFTYRHIGSTTGNSESSVNGGSYAPVSNKSGAGLGLFDTRFGVRIWL